MVKTHQFKYAKEWSAGSSEPHEIRYRKKKSSRPIGWFGQSHLHRMAALKGHRVRRY